MLVVHSVVFQGHAPGWHQRPRANFSLRSITNRPLRRFDRSEDNPRFPRFLGFEVLDLSGDPSFQGLEGPVTFYFIRGHRQHLHLPRIR